jgi:hypothetical protein
VTRPSDLFVPRASRKAAIRVLALACFAVTLMLPSTASATLQLLKPNPSDPATFTGRGGYSSDGLGQNTTGGTVQAEVPAGSTVVQAYLYGSYFGNTAPDAAERTINFDGTNVVLTTLANSEPGNSDLSTARATVTSQVATKVGSGGGITNFAINNDPATLDGVALVVIFSNPTLPQITIAVLDGGSQQTGDTATFNFASPINPAAPGFAATLALGSGFSYQGFDGHACGGGQFSTVNVNGSLLTNCAGNYDDGLGEDGSLLTVGGVGDSTNNPTPPDNPAEDDELYNLVPFLDNGDTSLVIDTTNPSGDDNLFLAVISTTALGAVTTEQCGNGTDDDGDGLVDGADPDCNVNGRMVGKGAITGTVGGTASYAYIVRCNSTANTNAPFEVRFGTQRFRLTGTSAVACTNDPAVSPTPSAGFDTQTGSGTGTLTSGGPGTIQWKFVDRGAGGTGDSAQITIKNSGGTTIFSGTAAPPGKYPGSDQPTGNNTAQGG